MTTNGRRRHTTRWIAGVVLVCLAVIGVVLATRTPQEATQVESPLVGHMAPLFSGADIQRAHGAPVSLRALRGHYVFVNFFASWCGPCKRISPLIESTASQLTGKVKFLKVNVDKLNDLSASYNVRSMPTILLFDPSGKEIERKVGTDQISDLLRRLEKAI